MVYRVSLVVNRLWVWCLSKLGIYILIKCSAHALHQLPPNIYIVFSSRITQPMRGHVKITIVLHEQKARGSLYNLDKKLACICLVLSFFLLLIVCFDMMLQNIFSYLIETSSFFQSAAELLLCKPDIACFAKLMTGGMIPLAATLATDAIFDVFVGDSKVIHFCKYYFCLNEWERDC